MKRHNKELIISIICIVIVFIIYIVLDYINLSHVVGVNFSDINIYLFSAVFNSFIVVLLYLITYFMIDKKQVKKEYNAKQTAHILMSLSYNKCKETISLLDNNEVIHKYIIPKVDFNKADSDNPVIYNTQNNPFIEFEHILHLAGNGYIDNKRLNRYLHFISDYKSYVSYKITFFDIDEAKTDEQIKLKNYIENMRESLISTINEELQLLDDRK